MAIFVKICGLSTDETVRAATAAGADCIGLVFFAKSPRNVSLADAERLAAVARRAPRVLVAALVVDAFDDLLDEIARRVRPDLLQLHGRESPERVRQIKSRTGIPVMKAVGIRDAGDLKAIPLYRDAADRILLDARPPEGAELPGGNGRAFDWRLIENLDLDHRFMLSGGLDPETVEDALRATGIRGVDVSSGVERAPGVKDPELIAAFVGAARRHPLEGIVP